jgi:hypothetical protein
MRKKLTTEIRYRFEEQLDFPELNIDIKLKTHRKHKHIITKYKKKTIDVSTKLF